MRPTRVRWVILLLLAAFSVVSNVERINLSVISVFIRNEFGLTDIQLGWSFSAFLVTYMLGQLPAGYLSDKVGSRCVLAAAALLWFAITVVMGAYLGFIASSAAQVVIALITLRAMLGLAEAPTLPATANGVACWFPTAERGTATAVITSFAYAGQALTLILMAEAVASCGWRIAVFMSAIPAAVLAVAWWHFGESSPDRHKAVNAAELALIVGDRDREGLDRSASSFLQAIANPHLVILAISYFCQGYVLYLFFFWFYAYLVDVRHFSVASGGLAGAMPILAAALCAFAGGWLSDFAARRWGSIRGRRTVIVISGFVGGALLMWGAVADNALLAVSCFVGAIGTRGLVESAYWATVLDLAGPRSGSAGGVVNMMGNLGGVVSTALSPVVVTEWGWKTALAVAAVLTAVSGMMLYCTKLIGYMTGDRASVIA